MAAILSFAPRAPVERQKSGTLDYTDQYPRKMLDWRDALKAQGAAELQACRDLQNIELLISLLDGVGWWAQGRPDWRSSFFDNVIAEVRVESLANLSDIKPAMDISCKIPEYQKQADNAHNIIRHQYINDAQDLRVVDWIDHALFGTGYIKIVGFTPGVIRTSAHALGKIIPVQMKGNDFQSAQAVIEHDYESLMYFAQTFGWDKAQNLHRYAVSLAAALNSEQYIRPDNIPEYQWNSLSPTMKRRMYLARVVNKPQRGTYQSFANPYPVIERMEIYHNDISINDYGHPVLIKHPELSVEDHNYHYIVQPKGPLFPRKRLTVFGGDDIMYDGPNVFWDGKYPYIQLQLNPCVWAPGGISKYRDIVPLARSANRIGVGVDETVVDAVNRTVVTRKGAIDPTSWDRFDPSRPKQKVMLNGTANPTADFKYMEAKVLPPYVEMWLRFLDNAIKRRAGIIDVGGMQRKRQVPGSDTVQAMQDALSGPYRIESRYVEDGIRQAAVLEVSRVFQFYTLDQRLRILGADGATWEDFSYISNNMVPAFAPKEDWWQQFSVNVAQGSMHGAAKYRKQVIVLNLLKANKVSLKSAYDILDVGLNAEEELQQIKREMTILPPPAPAHAQRGAGRQERTTRAERTGGI